MFSYQYLKTDISILARHILKSISSMLILSYYFYIVYQPQKA